MKKEVAIDEVRDEYRNEEVEYERGLGHQTSLFQSKHTKKKK